MAGQIVEETWLQSIKVELAEVCSPQTKKWSICRAPNTLRNNNSDAFSPHIISIGPIHHGREELKTMEKLKLYYTSSFFKRTSDPTVASEACANIILGLLDELLAYYEDHEGIKDPAGKKELVKLMLVDGCFILELLLRFSSNDPKFHKDPIFTSSWMISTLQRDLALLENQIPFVLLNLLFNLTVRHSMAKTTNVLHELALRFFQSALSVNEETIRTNGRQSCNHLLHLIHNCYLPTSSGTEREKKGPSEVISTATALSNYGGIQLRSDGVKNLVDVRFEKGIIKLPRFAIHDMTDSLFWNLLAFEQCCHRDAEYISSYVLLMDLLVNTNADVELLERAGIIKNYLADRNRICKFFNNIGKQVLLKKFYYAGLCEEVNGHYNRRIRQLTHLYFRRPWVIISVIAATLFIFALMLRVVFSALSYHQL